MASSSSPPPPNGNSNSFNASPGHSLLEAWLNDRVQRDSLLSNQIQNSVDTTTANVMSSNDHETHDEDTIMSASVQESSVHGSGGFAATISPNGFPATAHANTPTSTGSSSISLEDVDDISEDKDQKLEKTMKEKVFATLAETNVQLAYYEGAIMAEANRLSSQLIALRTSTSTDAHARCLDLHASVDLLAAVYAKKDKLRSSKDALLSAFSHIIENPQE